MEQEHVIANEVLNKAEIELMLGRKFIAYNTEAYFLSTRQVNFFQDKSSANDFILQHEGKAYKFIEIASVDDLLKKIPYGSIVAEAQESYSLEADVKDRGVVIVQPDVLHEIELALSKGENWMAYSGSLYALTKEVVYFFSNEEEARQFAKDNISDRDTFNVEYVVSANNLKIKTMNEQNMQYLKDNIKYMGFGEGLQGELEKQLKIGNPDFQLQFKGEMNKKPFEATLNFRKSDTTDMYFFNSYHAKMERSNGESKEQTFYLDKGKGITAKEAFNLLEGRAVYKELNNKAGESYHAWVQLDFGTKDKHNNNEVKQFHENYGYDLRAAVGKLAVSELGDPEKEKSLMQSLQKGNVQSVSVEQNGGAVKMFIEANPQFKTVNVYDASMKRVQKEDMAQYQSKQLVNEPAQGLRNDGGSKLAGGPAVEGRQATPSQSRGLKGEETGQKKTSMSKTPKNDLLPKKRTSQKKGLGIG